MTHVPISGAESRIMEVLWETGPLSAGDLVAAVAPAQGWSDATAKSLIGRLLKKRAVRSTRVDGRVLYSAIVARDDYVRHESQGFLDRVFGGRLAPLVSHFADERRLGPEDRAQLEALVRKLDDGR